MRAALLLTQPGDLTVTDIEIDSPGPHEVLVRTAACGICHSDLHALTGDVATQPPSVIGHEAAGVVEAVGESVTGFAPGDHVVACITPHCGTCPACARGEAWLCMMRDQPPLVRRKDDPPRLWFDAGPATQFLSVGGFAEQMLLSEKALVRVPKELPLDRASLLGCGTLTGFGTIVNKARVRPGESVVVVGCGGVGLSAIQTASMVGASPIIAIDIHEHALELAKEMGATVTINGAEEEAVRMVRALTHGGADHVVEAIGLPKTMQDIVDMIRPGGNAYCVGIAPVPSKIELSAFRLVWFNRSVHGVYMGASNFQHDIPALANLYLSGAFDLDHLVTERIGLDEINTGFDRMRSGSLGRVVVAF